MSNLTPEQLKLIADIEQAFENVTRDGGVTLHEAEADDDRLSEEEKLEARKLDTDTCWQEVPDETMMKIQSPWSFLDKKGMRYYLPAYMRFIIKTPGFYAGDMLVYSLIPFSSTQGDKANWSVELLVKNLHLTKEQCRVIFHFLKSEYEFGYEDDNEWMDGLKEWERLSEGK